MRQKSRCTWPAGCTRSTALWVSVASEVAALALWGFVGGLCVGAGRLGALITGVLNAVIGLGVVAVKLVAGH